MKRFLKHILLFVASMAILYLPLVWIAGTSGLPLNIARLEANYGHMGLRLQEADSLQERPDIVFIGSSHCYRTFDTRVYDSAGFRSFNLGSSIQTPKQSFALLSRYMEKWNNIQYIVIEVHPDIMDNSGVESACDIICNCRIDKALRRMALRQHSLRVFNTMCYCYVRQAFNPNYPPIEDSIVSVYTSSGDTSILADFAYIPGGYVELTPFCWRPRPFAPTTLTVDDKQLNALKACVNLAEKHSIKCLLVEVPSTKSRYISFTNHDLFEEKMLSLTSSHTKYLNLNNDSRLSTMLNDSTCFFDDDHLNNKGAEIFNQFFLTCILSD